MCFMNSPQIVTCSLLFVCFAVLGVKLKASANSRQALLLLSSTLSPVVLNCLFSVFIASMYSLEGRGVPLHVCEGQKTTPGSKSSSSPVCVGIESRCQVWWQAPIPAEPSRQFCWFIMFEIGPVWLTLIL